MKTRLMIGGRVAFRVRFFAEDLSCGSSMHLDHKGLEVGELFDFECGGELLIGSLIADAMIADEEEEADQTGTHVFLIGGHFRV